MNTWPVDRSSQIIITDKWLLSMPSNSVWFWCSQLFIEEEHQCISPNVKPEIWSTLLSNQGCQEKNEASLPDMKFTAVILSVFNCFYNVKLENSHQCNGSESSPVVLITHWSSFQCDYTMKCNEEAAIGFMSLIYGFIIWSFHGYIAEMNVAIIFWKDCNDQAVLHLSVRTRSWQTELWFTDKKHMAWRSSHWVQLHSSSAKSSPACWMLGAERRGLGRGSFIVSSQIHRSDSWFKGWVSELLEQKGFCLVCPSLRFLTAPSKPWLLHDIHLAWEGGV